MPEPTPEPAFDEATYAVAFGLKKRTEREFAEALVKAIAGLDRALLPGAAPHPLAHLIAEGPRSIDKLLQMVETAEGQAQFDAIDALAHVLLGAPSASKEASARLKSTLKDVDDAQVAALLEKTLAIAGDDASLMEQLKRLADGDPAVVASAARLLGFGRYRPAVKALKGLVSPERFYESRWVIWALGEIGDTEALPALEIALSQAFRVVDCLIAIGKIGQLTSIPKITPHLVSSFPEQKDAAVRALAMILDRAREQAKMLGPLRDQLAGMIQRELADMAAPLSTSTRFHMLLCLARLGVKLDEARTKKYLGVGVDPNATGAASIFTRVKPSRQPPPRPRR